MSETTGSDRRRFDGAVALVTGASRGIGLAIARRLVDEGAQVCITARKPEPLAEAVEGLGGAAHAMGVAGKADDVERSIINVIGSTNSHRYGTLGLP